MLKKITNERLIAILFFLPTIYIYVSKLSLYISPASVIRIILYPIAYSIGIIVYFRNIKQKKVLLILLFFLSLLIFNCFFFPQSCRFIFSSSTSGGIFLSDFMIFVFISLPLLFVSYFNNDSSIIINEFGKIGKYILILFIITYGLMMFVYNDSMDYMNIAYGIVPWLMFCWGYAKKNKKLLDLLLCLSTFLFICVSGCRGAALTCIIFFILMYASSFNKKITLKQILVFIVSILIIIIFLIYLNDIANFVYEILSKFGFKSRTLELFLGIGYEKGFTHYADRADVQLPLLSNINFFGYGLYGDRLLTTNFQYAHNLFLEWLIDFGILMGGLIILLFLYYIIANVKKLFFEKNYCNKIIISSCLSILCCKYMLSASYLHMPEFWLMIGLFIGNTKKIKFIFKNS